MTKPALRDLPPSYRAQAAAQLASTPRPRTVKIELAEPNRTKPRKQFRQIDAVPIMAAAGIPVPEREYRFHESRRWRFDYAWVWAKVALEVNGGIFTGGRHVRGLGFREDMKKMRAAGARHWIVLSCEPRDLYNHETLTEIKQALKLL